jgi:2-keto-4-pentenoate hydratase
MIKELDPRVRRGMERQLDLRRSRLEAGERPIGWKVGFGSKSAMERLGIASPLVGFLTDAVVLASGTDVSAIGWASPAIEPEIAIHIGRQVAAGDGREGLRAAVAAIGPAIELADVDPPPNDVEEILAGNIFNRHVILGREDRTRAGCDLDGLLATMYGDEDELARPADLLALTGDLIEIVRHVASLLSHFGETLRPGEVIIAGSIIPPLRPETSLSFRYELEPIDTVSVQIVL